MSQQFMYFICDNENKEAVKSLIEKFSTKSGSGAIIVLNAKEHYVLKNMITVPISPSAKNAVYEHGRKISEYCLPCGRTSGGE